MTINYNKILITFEKWLIITYVNDHDYNNNNDN